MVVKVEVKKETCPSCGADRAALAQCCSGSATEDRSVAWMITENCPDCKEAMENLFGRSETMETNQVDTMLDDIGTGEEPGEAEIREATRQYCVDKITAYTEAGAKIDEGELEQLAIAFEEGYVACLNKRA